MAILNFQKPDKVVMIDSSDFEMPNALQMLYISMESVDPADSTNVNKNQKWSKSTRGEPDLTFDNFSQHSFLFPTIVF